MFRRLAAPITLATSIAIAAGVWLGRKAADEYARAVNAIGRT